jgi:hypothetical protein
MEKAYFGIRHDHFHSYSFQIITKSGQPVISEVRTGYVRNRRLGGKASATRARWAGLGRKCIAHQTVRAPTLVRVRVANGRR